MNTKLIISGVEINLSKETQEELESKFKPMGLWKPKEGEEYYWINTGNKNKVDYITFKKDMEIVEADILIGNCFRTVKEAQQHLNKLLAIQRVKEYIASNFGIFEPDWDDGSEDKFNIYYDYEYEEISYIEEYYNKNYSPIGYIQSEEDCEQLIKDCKEDLLLIFK